MRDPNDTETFHQLDQMRAKFGETTSILGEAIQDYYAECLAIKGKLAHAEEEAKRADARLLATEQELRAIKSSRSWRFTRPLRRLSTRVTKLLT